MMADLGYPRRGKDGLKILKPHPGWEARHKIHETPRLRTPGPRLLRYGRCLQSVRDFC